MIGKIIKWSILGVIVYFVFFPPRIQHEIAKYRYRRDKAATIKNFQKHEKDFEEFLEWVRERKLQPLHFSISSDTIDLSISNPRDSTSKSELFYHFKFHESTGYQFKLSRPWDFPDEEILKIYSNWKELNFDSLKTIAPWRINFYGKPSNPVFQKILNYRGWTLEDFEKTASFLKKVNCQKISISKEGHLYITYKMGNVLDSFDYITKIPDWVEEKTFQEIYLPKKLNENFYWEYSEFISNCWGHSYYIPN